MIALQVGDREYKLHLIKLDTVAMKTALSDVLTNPLVSWIIDY